MRYLPQNDTIVAVATPPGSGAIGIVRLSGPHALAVLRKMWTSEVENGDNFLSRRFYLGNIVDLSTKYPIDKVLAVFFQSPASYTGEDIVEIHGHGNPVILDLIVTQCLSAGARLATPGEFTRRAFLNGRIDLVQAESVADVIACSTSVGVRRAQEHLEGRLSQPLRECLTKLTGLRAFVEASIDFPEEDVALLAHENITGQIGTLLAVLSGLMATYQEGKLAREGARVVLVGPPNAGKSSLLNALLGCDRAIVHHVAGTTRDALEEIIVVDGIPLRLTDVAGLRSSQDCVINDVEQIGIDRARALAQAADLRVIVLDASRPLTAADRSIFQEIQPERCIVWCNKSDQGCAVTPAQIHTLIPGAPILFGSALQGDGLSQLKDALLVALRTQHAVETDGVVISNRRHRDALEKCNNALKSALEAVSLNSAEFVAEHLRCASQHLGSIVGDVTDDDLLDEIFRRFCIGK